MSSEYHVITTRPADAWNRVAQCGEITVSYDPSGESGSVKLCRALREAGQPDGRMTFVSDETGQLDIPSIYAWADHEPTYQAIFGRPRETVRPFWYACKRMGIRVEQEPNENGLVKLCQAMVAAGQPDGDMMLVEVAAKVPLHHYVPSIHRYASLPLVSRPSTSQAKAAPAKSLSEDWYRLLVDIRDGRLDRWREAHAKTKGALKANGFVTDNEDGLTLTKAAEAAIARFEKPLTYQEMEPDELAEVAATMGLRVNGDRSTLADTLSALDAAIRDHSLADIEHTAMRHGVTVRYGKGNKGEALKKRIVLVAIVNAGHDPAQIIGE